MRRLVPWLLALVAMLATVPLFAQAVDSAAVATALAPIINLMTVGVAAAGTFVYQLIKKGIAPLDRLPGGIHAAITLVANVLWQTFAPAISAHIGYTVPGDLHQFGPPAVTGFLFFLITTGLHALYVRLRDWVMSKTTPATPRITGTPPRAA
jgi:hypothetical protein